MQASLQQQLQQAQHHVQHLQVYGVPHVTGITAPLPPLNPVALAAGMGGPSCNTAAWAPQPQLAMPLQHAQQPPLQVQPPLQPVGCALGLPPA
jgi:hypothetical protein